jgi:hypothetical protein
MQWGSVVVMKKLALLFLLLATPAFAQEEMSAKINTIIAQQIGLLEIAKVSLQVQLEAANAEIVKLKKDLEAKSGNKP